MFYEIKGSVEAIRVEYAEITGTGVDGAMFSEMKDWLRALFISKVLKIDHTGAHDYVVLILSTDDGDYKLFPGDYIVRMEGKVYPVKAGFFDAISKE
jgi:hypothetical protein